MSGSDEYRSEEVCCDATSRLIDASRPPTPVAHGISEQHIRELCGESRESALRRGRWAAVAGIGALLLVLGGGSVAYAAGVAPAVPDRFERPKPVVQPPGGSGCEMRLRVLPSGDAEFDEAAKRLLASYERPSEEEVDTRAREIFGEDHAGVLTSAQRGLVASGLRTEQLWEDLQGLGFDLSTLPPWFGVEGVGSCGEGVR